MARFVGEGRGGGGEGEHRNVERLEDGRHLLGHGAVGGTDHA